MKKFELLKEKEEYKYKNEEEIKKFKIEKNDMKINFTYFYKF